MSVPKFVPTMVIISDPSCETDPGLTPLIVIDTSYGVMLVFVSKMPQLSLTTTV